MCCSGTCGGPSEINQEKTKNTLRDSIIKQNILLQKGRESIIVHCMRLMLILCPALY